MRIPHAMVAGATALCLSVTGSWAGAATSPHVVDVTGDANALTMPYTHGGAVGGLMRLLFPEDPLGPGVPSGPASWAPGDLHSVAFSTVYTTMPDGPVPSAIRLAIVTGARPTGLPGGATYVVRATVQGEDGAICPVFFEAGFPRDGAPTPTAAVQLGNTQDACVYTDLLSITDERFTAVVGDNGLTLTFPLDVLSEQAAPFFGDDTTLASPSAWVNVALVGRTDTAPAGRTFRLAEDQPGSP